MSEHEMDNVTNTKDEPNINIEVTQKFLDQIHNSCKPGPNETIGLYGGNFLAYGIVGAELGGWPGAIGGGLLGLTLANRSLENQSKACELDKLKDRMDR